MAKRKIHEAKPVGDLLPPRQVEGAPVLTAAAEPVVEQGLKLLEYLPLGDSGKWRVEKYEDFAIEFQSVKDAEAMTQFHELALGYSRSWLMARQVFGIGPVILPAGSDPEDFRPKARAEVCARFTLTPAELQAEFDVLRARGGHRKKAPLRAAAQSRGQAGRGSGSDEVRARGAARIWF
jgi:hypothetical protein